MKLVTSVALVPEDREFIDVERVVLDMQACMIKVLIDEKNRVYEKLGGSSSPRILDAIAAYDRMIDAVETRKWGK